MTDVVAHAANRQMAKMIILRYQHTICLILIHTWYQLYTYFVHQESSRRSIYLLDTVQSSAIYLSLRVRVRLLSSIPSLYHIMSYRAHSHYVFVFDIR